MRLSEISIENYKSYFEKQTVAIEPGFNIFLGGNNSGKTTMLEALDIDEGAQNPHRSMKNLRDFGTQPYGASKMTIKLETDIYEMRNPQNRLLMLPIGEEWRNGLPVNDPAAGTCQEFCVPGSRS